MLIKLAPSLSLSFFLLLFAATTMAAQSFGLEILTAARAADCFSLTDAAIRKKAAVEKTG